MDQADPNTIEEMRAWAVGQNYRSLCGDEIVEASDMTDMEILHLMDSAYPGGSDAWDNTSDQSENQDAHISWAPHGQWT